MLGAAGALSALTVLAQEHGDMLQALSGPAVTQMRGLLVRALQSDLVTKSAKVAATHGGKGAAPAPQTAAPVEPGPTSPCSMTTSPAVPRSKLLDASRMQTER